MKAFKSRYYNQLILFAVCLIALPVAAVGMFSYYRSSHTIQERVNSSSLQLLEQTRQRVEQSLRTADNAVIQFASSTTLSRLLSIDVTEVHRSENILLIDELREGLGRIKTFDLGPGDVQFLQLRYRWKFTTNGGYQSFAPDEPDWATMIDARRGSYWTINNDTIDFVKPLPATSLEPVAIVILKIPLQDISKYLNPRQGMGKPFIYDRDFRMVYDTVPLQEEQLAKLSPYIQQIEESKREEGLIPVRAGGESYNVIFSKSDYSGWTYASFISVREMNREAEAIKWFTLFICLFVVAAGVAVSLPGTRRIYVPIRRLYEEVVAPRAEEELLRGKNEFELIGEKVRHYVQTELKMTHELQYQRNQLNDFFMMRLFLGEARPEELEEPLAAQVALWTNMNVIVVQIDTWEGTAYGDNDRNLLLYAAANIAAELVPPANRLLKPIVTDQSIALLLGSERPEEHGKLVDQHASRIQQMLKQYLKFQASIGISRPFHNLKHTARAYKEALNALNYRIKLGYESILYMEDVSPNHRIAPEYPEKLKSELTDAIKLYERERAYGLLKQFSQEIFSVPLSHREYQMMMIVLLTDLLKVLQEAGGLPQALYGEEKSLFDQIFELQTPDQMVEWFHESIVDPSILLLEEQKNSQHRRISDELLQMVHNEYNTNLTLEGCALRINYHPDYVRHVFRREIGITFGDYLAQYRLKIAKAWLAETPMKISEIAERLQYTNPQNFIRYFRKMEGMTPGQYRSAQYDTDGR
ncbi:Helix-turn-helix domain-containing protein [Paenibacillus sp. 1_12]|uniref:helix-turn-helix domain-containing protein n=1 Tax=Paenibacillus sp. 1_12 TaxID=1566278 RepID=UPI0008E80639|nr:helix-turn-helix domain-containing protein [Paenibacillus sp. 1_12]SFM15824.1 Helix-turn-helix domain-containing protein [Paenibacillus sp. 1_12]